MSHEETNPHFHQQQQPLLAAERAPPRQLDRDSHTPPWQPQAHDPLHEWRGLTQRPGHDPQAPSRPTSEPLHGWTPMAEHPLGRPEPEPAPKLKKQKRQGKDSKRQSTVAWQPQAQAPDHLGILPHVPRPENQGPPPPSGSPADEQPRLARHQKPIRPESRTPQRFLPKDRRTKLPAWFAAIFCAIFWIVIILGGLVVLIVYLVFRPKSPRFDVSNVNLNAAYLDMGYLLNADLVLLVNFTNPNHKVSIDFSNMYLDLYFENTMIATQYVQPFSAPRSRSMLANIHMMSSQVPLALKESLQLQQQIENSSVIFDLKGKFRARSNFGSLIRYSYWLHGLCRVIVSSPPTGVLKGKNCITKQ